MRFSFQRLLAGLAIAAALTRPAIAQNTITLEGTVKSDGAALPGAQVTVVNVATQEQARAVTRANGDFRVIGLFAGRYQVTVRSLGFKPNTETLQLAIGQRGRLEFAMEQGAA